MLGMETACEACDPSRLALSLLAEYVMEFSVKYQESSMVVTARYIKNLKKKKNEASLAPKLMPEWPETSHSAHPPITYSWACKADYEGFC